jgi:hypothetical protein
MDDLFSYMVLITNDTDNKQGNLTQELSMTDLLVLSLKMQQFQFLHVSFKPQLQQQMQFLVIPCDNV